MFISAPITPNFYTSNRQSPFAYESVSPRKQQPTRDYSFYGYLLLFGTSIFFVFNVWTLILCDYYSTGTILDWFQSDRYYKYLIPLLIPVFLGFAIVNWLGMKYFRHNA
ncbi:hypothetical protein EDD86DRAFT_193995 [Gorgonomyces haynaldii]|nr:hypothetical protein EDD86DRAFT_193995 [Gorgonomyces haynaldii]